MAQVRAGRMRTLAVSTAKRSELAPEIPHMKEAGLPEQREAGRQ
jgi:tripartite-type tricarboxylate transporter receptor subunit TctC